MYHVDIRVEGKQKYKLLDTLVYIDDKWIVTILSGFTYDGASIPTSLWSIVGCPIDYAYAAAVHDALYGTRFLDRKTCDKIFHKALIKSGVDSITAKAMYLAVRAGGSSAYDGMESISDDRKYVMVALR